jgi:ArsR family transcriptional regulator
MDQTTAAQGFAAMGSEARLSVLNCLIRAGEAGLTVGEIGARTGIAASTLAHHLKFLAGAEVIRQTREGRTVGCRADFDRLRDLAGFILTECCADAPAQSQPNVADHG